MESPYYFPIRGQSTKRVAVEGSPPVGKPAPNRRARPRPDNATLPPMPHIPGCRALRPGDPGYETKLKTYNARTDVRPALRATCSTSEAVAGVVDWAKRNGVPFAVRSGGHSFEGYCCSPHVVIDVQNLNRIAFDARRRTISVGAGVTLGAIYKALRDQGSNLAFVAGTCPTVGAAGHVLGGGYGFLSRAYGLACDNLLSVGMVDANARHIQASATENADLFWACRGGGGGSFGILTDFTFQTHRVDGVYTFKLVWSLPKARAKRLIKAWQSWAPKASDALTPLLKIGKTASGVYGVRCIGQSIGKEAQLRRELAVLTSVEPTAVDIKHKKFFDAVDGFSGGWDYTSSYCKERSDFVTALSDVGIDTLLDRLMSIPAGHVVALLNAYGGAIGAVAPDASAFPHRKGTGYCIHYYSSWRSRRDTSTRLRESALVFGAMRPHVSGGAYVNYCDADLANYELAYWGSNLARLKQIKRQYDPGNLFRHGQSVPPA